MSAVLAIVGRPNVGKSALFNRIVGRRLAIVHDQPGVTRDRLAAEAEWNGKKFTLIDTGGIGLVRGEKSGDKIAEAALDQVNLALEAASLIVLVVNGQEGLTPLDEEVARRLRKTAKPVLVAVNKVDQPQGAGPELDFARLGYPDVFPLSAIHGHGVAGLLDAAVARSSAADPVAGAAEPEAGAPEQGPLRLAIVGRPNVGKSSLINALTGTERVIVSAIPGTTRDAIDVPFEIETNGVRERFVLIDTAGQRKTRRVDESVEFFSVKRAEDSIARCDIAILVLDAEAGITEQDKKIAGKIELARKACLVVVNKWDLVREPVVEARKAEIAKRAEKTRRHRNQPMTTLGEFGVWVQEQVFFLDYAPVIFTSALQLFQLDRLLEAIRFVADQMVQKVPTALLNRALNDAIEKHQPVSQSGSRLKFFYATQVGTAPPRFLLFVNRLDLFTDRYRKYLSDELRKAFGFEGCPIIVNARARPKTVESIHRKHRSGRRQKRA